MSTCCVLTTIVLKLNGDTIQKLNFVTFCCDIWPSAVTHFIFRTFYETPSHAFLYRGIKLPLRGGIKRLPYPAWDTYTRTENYLFGVRQTGSNPAGRFGARDTALSRSSVRVRVGRSSVEQWTWPKYGAGLPHPLIVQYQIVADVGLN